MKPKITYETDLRQKNNICDRIETNKEIGGIKNYVGWSKNIIHGHHGYINRYPITILATSCAFYSITYYLFGLYLSF